MDVQRRDVATCLCVCIVLFGGQSVYRADDSPLARNHIYHACAVVTVKKRGVCPVCGYQWAVTKRGMLFRHSRLYRGKSSMCAGVGRPADIELPLSADAVVPVSGKGTERPRA